jgi:hypothetical protein
LRYYVLQYKVRKYCTHCLCFKFLRAVDKGTTSSVWGFSVSLDRESNSHLIPNFTLCEAFDTLSSRLCLLFRRPPRSVLQDKDQPQQLFLSKFTLCEGIFFCVKNYCLYSRVLFVINLLWSMQ